MEELLKIKAEIARATAEIPKLAAQIRAESVAAANAQADYDERKHQFLIDLFDEEAEQKFKRTEAQRQSLYRNAFKRERRAAMLAKAELDSSRDLFRGLQSTIMALQTQARLVEAQMRME